ncbi:hypothetical protein BD414DRAFT_495318 [Trametes punicea]|nr:hypothetical protein BD414DRAFT_495318 [Trametes punicea]
MATPAAALAEPNSSGRSEPAPLVDCVEEAAEPEPDAVPEVAMRVDAPAALESGRDAMGADALAPPAAEEAPPATPVSAPAPGAPVAAEVATPVPAAPPVAAEVAVRRVSEESVAAPVPPATAVSVGTPVAAPVSVSVAAPAPVPATAVPVAAAVSVVKAVSVATPVSVGTPACGTAKTLVQARMRERATSFGFANIFGETIVRRVRGEATAGYVCAGERQEGGQLLLPVVVRGFIYREALASTVMGCLRLSRRGGLACCAAVKDGQPISPFAHQKMKEGLSAGGLGARTAVRSGVACCAQRWVERCDAHPGLGRPCSVASKQSILGTRSTVSEDAR